MRLPSCVLNSLSRKKGLHLLLQIMKCQHASGGFGGSERNDPHILYTLSALQVLALYDKLDLVNTDQVTACEYSALCSSHQCYVISQV